MSNMLSHVVNKSAEQLSKLVSCAAITEGEVEGTLNPDGRVYVVTGADYRGPDILFWAVPCIPLKAGQADHPKPRTYVTKVGVLHRLSETGRHKKMAERIRDNFYSGMVFRYQRQEWILLSGEVVLTPAKVSESEQLALFS